MSGKDLLNFLKINPSEKVTVKPKESIEISIENSGKKQVAYKLKTTRPGSVKPDKSFGIVPKNGRATVKIQFKPGPNEKPFLSEDRVTLMFNVLPASFSTAEKFWKSSSSATDAKRVVLKLERAGEKSVPKKKKSAAKKEPEEEPASEKTEAEEEGNTASEG